MDPIVTVSSVSLKEDRNLILWVPMKSKKRVLRLIRVTTGRRKSFMVITVKHRLA